MSSEFSNVSVFVRLRPPDGKQQESPENAATGQEKPFEVDNDRNTLTVRSLGKRTSDERQFTFDQIFEPDTDQAAMFRSVALPMVDHVLDGFNSCCFAYGQTGAGKTYTIFGGPSEERGLVPRTVEHLFAKMQQRRAHADFRATVSMQEVYLDKVRDLGKYYDPKQRSSGSGWGTMGSSQHAHRSSSSQRNSRPRSGKSNSGTVKQPNDTYMRENLEIHQDAAGTVFVKGLVSHEVHSVKDVEAIVRTAVNHRQTHETKMNEVSSRSHTIVTITVIQCDKRSGETMSGQLHFVDLAGSERLGKSKSEGVRMQEAVMINSSLTALGKVVMSLSQGRIRHVPYRDSKLTRILQNSLGGNSYTTLVATVNSHHAHTAESLNTLLFAYRCRNVENQVRVNYVDTTATNASQDSRIAKLLREIAQLRKLFALTSRESDQQIRVLQEQLNHYRREKGEKEVAVSGLDTSAIVATAARVMKKSASKASVQAENDNGSSADQADQRNELAALLESVGMDHAQLADTLASDEQGGLYLDEHQSERASGAQQPSSSAFGLSKTASFAPMPRLTTESEAALQRKVRNSGQTIAQQTADFKTLHVTFAKHRNQSRQRDLKLQKEVTQLQEELAKLKKKHVVEMADLKEQRKEDQKRLVRQTQTLLEQQHRVLSSVPDRTLKSSHGQTMGRLRSTLLASPTNSNTGFDNNSPKHQNGRPAAADSTVSFLVDDSADSALLASERQKWKQHQDRLLDNQRQQFEFFLAKKSEQLEKLQASLQRESDEHTQERRHLDDELRALYQFAEASSTIIQNMETGAFPIQEKSGIRMLKVPSAARASLAVDESRLRNIARLSKTADAFVRRMRKLAKMRTVDPASMMLLQGESSGHRQTIGGRDAMAVTARDQKQGFERQVLEELNSHATVEYIRKLEDEKQHYQHLLQDKTRDVKDLRVAYNAQTRVLSRLQKQSLPSRPSTAMTSRSSRPSSFRSQTESSPTQFKSQPPPRPHTSAGHRMPSGRTLGGSQRLTYR